MRSPFRVDFYSMSLAYRAPISLGYHGRLGSGGHAIELGTKTIPVTPGAVAGRVDRSAAENGSIHFVGWAANLSSAHPAEEVDVFSHGTLVYSTSSSGDRPDVAAFYGDDAIRRSGFDFLVPLGLVGKTNRDVRVFGVVDGKASELSYHQGYAWTG